MRLQELGIRDQQLDELNVGKAVKTVGRGIGKAVGGVAQGIGAIAGGIAGIPGAVKKGFQAGKATVSGTNANQTQTPASGTGASQTQPATNVAQPQQSGGAQTQPTTNAAQPQQSGGALSSFKQGLEKSLDGGQTQQNQEPAAGDATTADQPAATPQTAQPQTQQTQTDQAQEKPQEQPSPPAANVVTALKDRILKLDTASRQEIFKVVQSAYLSKVSTLGDKTDQKSAAGGAADQSQPAADAEKPAAQTTQTDQEQPTQADAQSQEKSPEQSSQTDQQPADSETQSQGGMPPGRFGKEAERLAQPMAGADSETPGKALSGTAQNTADTEPASAAEPAQADQSLDLEKHKQRVAQEKDAARADQAAAGQQIKDTAAANSAAAAERNAMEKAAKDAAAKPGFQRTLADKNAIKAAQEKGIKVEAAGAKNKKKIGESKKTLKNRILQRTVFKENTNNQGFMAGFEKGYNAPVKTLTNLALGRDDSPSQAGSSVNAAVKLKDPSGKIPIKIMNSINQLNTQQRTELYNTLLKYKKTGTLV